MAGRGYASIDEKKKHDVESESESGKDSNSNRIISSRSSSINRTRGAVGSTEAAKRGGKNSHRIS